MIPVSTLKNIMPYILLAGLMCGMAGVVHAQLGAEEVSGMGEQGPPAGSAFDPSPPGKKGVTFIEPANPGTQQETSIPHLGGRTPATGSPGAAQQFLQQDMSIPDPAGRGSAMGSPDAARQSPNAAQQFVPPYGGAVPGQSPFVGGY